ncbi:hypothetical protein GXW74_16160 [Roseomonas eburnea]|uniref:Uncharacterized protein n=1 Tax=Neoroseomonas eburnea TaxID=1346889 RepID=A0A9X9XE94_9PROT|nr:hypothetical protein [Neoroseomonas eburnea]MBR0682030.1 hypothetical protein [Neoroseomonas eburnea]
MAVGPAPVAVMVFDDPAVVAAALRDVAVEYLSLAPGPFAARLTSVDLGAMRFQDALDDAHIGRGAVAPDRMLMLFAPEELPPRTLLNGHAMASAEAMVLGPSTEFFARVR